MLRPYYWPLYFLPLRFLRNNDEKKNRVNLKNLIAGPAVRGMEIPEDVELVQASEGDEKKIPYHQHCAVLTVQLPAVGMRRHHQEDYSGE